MRKGLIVTLATVAIAMMGFHAMSMAPTIDDIPDIIVGDLEGSTSANVFVFPEALDLNSLATDDSSTPGQIIWSFAGAAGRYTINGVEGLNLATTDPATPGSGHIGQVLQGETDGDSNARTVTVRDTTLSPFPAVDQYWPEPVTTGVLASEVITLFASDGTSFSSKDLIVYTANEEEDATSGSAFTEVIPTIDFGSSDSTFGWAYKQELDPLTETFGIAAGGLCLQAPAGSAGDVGYIGHWATDYGFIDLGQNQVYRVRVTVTSDVTADLVSPLWSMLFSNISEDYLTGQNAYTSEFLNLGNEGSASAATQPGASFGRTSFSFYFAPVCVQTAQWNDASTGAFISANDAGNDVNVTFRMLDAGDHIVAENRLGTLCLEDLEVQSVNIGKVDRLSVPYEVTTLTDGDSGGNVTVKDFGDTTTTFPSGDALIVPADGDWDVEVATLKPGDSDDNPDPTSGDDITDNYVVDWNAEELLMIEASISAPDAAAATNPPDILKLRVDTPTSEWFCDSLVTPNMDRAGTPKTTAATYTMFFYTHSGTASALTGYDALRPLVEVVCHTALSAQGLTDNVGGVKVHSLKVSKVKF